MNFRNVSSWCIRNPVFPIVLFVGLMLAGLSGNEAVVLSAGPFLNPGQKVNPKRQAAR